jgi:hypothetical protein
VHDGQGSKRVADRGLGLVAAAAVGDVGSLQRHMVVGHRYHINIIGSSADTAAERAVLEADVWPYLAELCRAQVRTPFNLIGRCCC